jgi:hypothetical protein
MECDAFFLLLRYINAPSFNAPSFIYFLRSSVMALLLGPIGYLCRRVSGPRSYAYCSLRFVPLHNATGKAVRNCGVFLQDSSCHLCGGIPCSVVVMNDN